MQHSQVARRCLPELLAAPDAQFELVALKGAEEGAMTYDHIRVEPLSTALGAEIGGVDLAAPLPEPALAEIRHAFGEHGVIFFRDQLLTPEQHLAFARRFGGVDVNRFFAAVPGLIR